MKRDALITVRLPRATRQRIELMARGEGRSLSGQVERLLERAMAADEIPDAAVRRPLRARRLEGLFARSRVPDLAEFREVRRALSASLDRGTRHGPTAR